MLIKGFLITLVFWFLSWQRFPMLSEHAFFPLWFGYIITINGLSEFLFGTSLIKKFGSNFIWLFIISLPFWWIFEFFNTFVQNWHYIMERPVTNVEFFIRASIDFSIVIPAVLSSTFLVYEILKKIRKFEIPRINITRLSPLLFFILGILLLTLVMIFPYYTFPLLWVSLFLIIDPVNYFIKFPSILNYLEKGDITFIVSLMSATLFTGFWWELWNYYSLPQWYYTVPYLDFYKVFEMPILGFLGYPFFGLELFAFSSLMIGIFLKKDLLKIFKGMFD